VSLVLHSLEEDATVDETREEDLRVGRQDSIQISERLLGVSSELLDAGHSTWGRILAADIVADESVENKRGIVRGLVTSKSSDDTRVDIARAGTVNTDVLVVAVAAEVACADVVVERGELHRRVGAASGGRVTSSGRALGPVSLVQNGLDEVAEGVLIDLGRSEPLRRNGEVGCSRVTNSNDTVVEVTTELLLVVNAVLIDTLDTVAVVVDVGVAGGRVAISATGVDEGVLVVAILTTPVSTTEGVLSGEVVVIVVDSGVVLGNITLELRSSQCLDLLGLEVVLKTRHLEGVDIEAGTAETLNKARSRASGSSAQLPQGLGRRGVQREGGRSEANALSKELNEVLNHLSQGVVGRENSSTDSSELRSEGLLNTELCLAILLLSVLLQELGKEGVEVVLLVRNKVLNFEGRRSGLLLVKLRLVEGPLGEQSAVGKVAAELELVVARDFGCNLSIPVTLNGGRKEQNSKSADLGKIGIDAADVGAQFVHSIIDIRLADLGILLDQGHRKGAARACHAFFLCLDRRRECREGEECDKYARQSCESHRLGVSLKPLRVYRFSGKIMSLSLLSFEISSWGIPTPPVAETTFSHSESGFRPGVT